jgi:hypothetical protein
LDLDFGLWKWNLQNILLFMTYIFAHQLDLPWNWNDALLEVMEFIRVVIMISMPSFQLHNFTE